MVIGNVLLIVLIMFSFPVAEKVRDLFESVNLPHHVKMVKGLEKIFRVLLVMSFFTLIIELCITEKSVLWQDLSLNATLLILIACAMFVFVMVFFKLYCLWRFISVELLIRRLAKGEYVTIEPPGIAAYIVSAVAGLFVTVLLFGVIKVSQTLGLY